MMKSVQELSMEDILEEEERVAQKLESYNATLKTLEVGSEEAAALAREVTLCYEEYIKIAVEKELAEGLLSGSILLN